jgi:hypothetical protein
VGLATAQEAPTTTQQPVSLDRHFLRCCLRSPMAMGAAPMTLMAAAPMMMMAAAPMMMMVVAAPTMMMAAVRTRIANAASVPHAPRVPAVLRTMSAPENSHVVTQAALVAPGTRIAVSGNQSPHGDTHRYSATPVQLARQMSPLNQKPPRQSPKVRSP